MAPREVINWAIYNSLPPNEAQYQLAHVYESKRVSVIITCAICFPIQFLAVIIRFVSRRVGHIKCGADDWIMVLGLVLGVMNSVMALIAIFAYGGARHAILMMEPATFVKYTYIIESLYPPIVAVLKISTLLLFARIFPSQKFRRTLWAVGLLISTGSGIMVLTSIFQCRPIKNAWNLNTNTGCINISKASIAMASLNVVTDFLVVCLPLPLLWRLQIRRGAKLQLTGIFSIGSLATFISIYRIPQLYGVSPNSYDPSWDNTNPWLWSIAEITAIILGACAITYRPLFNWIFGIKAPPAAQGAELVDTRNQPGTHSRLPSVPNVGVNIKMQSRKLVHSPLSTSVQNSRMVGTEDGFRRTQDPTEA